MIRLNIKPLSVNQCWQGKRFKTPEYKAYEREMLFKLPVLKLPDSDRLALHIIVGYSNKQADIDNVSKALIDILQKKYGFNDNKIYRLLLEKFIVLKGEEFISFKFSEMSDYLF